MKYFQIIIAEKKMSGGGVRTRHSSETKLASYIGPGKALLCTELPTLRCILRHGLLLQEERLAKCGTESMSTYPLKYLARDMTEALLNVWHKANLQFCPPVVTAEDSIQKKLKLAWETLQNIAWKRVTKKSQIEAFEGKLDKLVDITKCRCEIVLCDSFGCEQCEQGVHIKCSCPRDMKLPVKDLLFLKTQREKTSSKGAMMISSCIDVKEQIQEEKRLKLKELMKKRAQNNREKESKAKHELETRIDEDDSVSPMEEESPPLQEKQPAVAERIQTRNTVEVTGLASSTI